jgi:hypothetical protein
MDVVRADGFGSGARCNGWRRTGSAHSRRAASRAIKNHNLAAARCNAVATLACNRASQTGYGGEGPKASQA